MKLTTRIIAMISAGMLAFPSIADAKKPRKQTALEQIMNTDVGTALQKHLDVAYSAQEESIPSQKITL